MYLSLGGTYEAETCTIVISIKKPFKCYLVCYRLDCDPKSLKKCMIYRQGFKSNLAI